MEMMIKMKINYVTFVFHFIFVSFISFVFHLTFVVVMSLVSFNVDEYYFTFESFLRQLNEHAGRKEYVVILFRTKKIKKNFIEKSELYAIEKKNAHFSKSTKATQH